MFFKGFLFIFSSEGFVKIFQEFVKIQSLKLVKDPQRFVKIWRYSYRSLQILSVSDGFFKIRRGS